MLNFVTLFCNIIYNTENAVCHRKILLLSGFVHDVIFLYLKLVISVDSLAMAEVNKFPN